MKKLVQKVLSCYGVTVQVETEDRILSVKGFFRFVKSDAWQQTQQVFSPLGQVPRGRYIFLLPMGTEVSVGATLSVGQKKYTACRVEETTFFDEQVCLWCLCVEKGAE